MRTRRLRFDPVLCAAALVVATAGIVLGGGFLAVLGAVLLIALPNAWRLASRLAEEYLWLPPAGSRERAIVLRARRAHLLIDDLTGARRREVLWLRGREVRLETRRVVDTVEAFAQQSVGISRISARLSGSVGPGGAAVPRVDLAAVGTELLERADALAAGIENVAANIARLAVVHETGALAADGGGMDRVAGEIDSLRLALQEAQQFSREAAALTVLEV